MTFPKHTPRKVIRDIRYEEQGGKCYYCKHPMIKELPGPGGGHPRDLCTLEHLIDKLDPHRWDVNTDDSPRRYAAACAACNRARSEWSSQHAPKELIKMLSQCHGDKSSKEIILGYYATHEYVPPPPFVPKWLNRG